MINDLTIIRKKIVEHRNNLKNVKIITIRVKNEKIKIWNLFKRFFRNIRVLRSKSSKFYSYNDVIDYLNESIIEIKTIDSIYTLIWNNVIELNKHFVDFVEIKLFVDMHNQLNSKSLLQLQFRMMNFKLKIQKIKKIINETQIIEKNEVSQ